MTSLHACATSWRTRWRPALPVVLVAALAGSAWLAPAHSAFAQAPAATATNVVPPGMLENREIRAQLMPRRYTTLAAEIGAKVSRVPVTEGGRFRAGDTLVSFDCSLQQAQLDKAQATLVAAEMTWNANTRLNELNSVGKVELAISEAEVNKTRAEVASSKAILGKCAAIAPFPGRVAEQKVREQQYVQPGQALLEILDDSELDLEFIVPSRWLTWVKPGYGFRVAIDETGKTYPAKVRSTGARVDPGSQSVKLIATIDGKFNELVSGMSGRVLISPRARQ
jgi:membrane fusion protein (multidrug efflux system)